jgi:predicted glycosyltransferase
MQAITKKTQKNITKKRKKTRKNTQNFFLRVLLCGLALFFEAEKSILLCNKVEKIQQKYVYAGFFSNS